MPEYLGYINPANVKANPTLDWGSVITNVQDTLTSQESQRQANRDKAAKEYSEVNKELNNISLSRGQDINDFLTSSVYRAKDINLETYKLYTSGKINSKQLNVIQSNIKTGFNEFDALGKNISKIQENYADLSEQGKSSFLADYNMNQLGNSLDLKNKIPYVDPSTGLMYVATLDKDGKPDLSKLDSPKWMLSQGDIPVKLDVVSEIGKYTKDLGKFEQVLKTPPAGGIWTLEDASKRPGFNDWLENTANAIASNPIRQASILGDYIGGYNATSDASSKDANSIVMKKDYTTGINTPVLTPEQEKESKDAIKTAILSQVNSTLKQQENTYRPPTGGSGDSKSTDKEPKSYGGAPTVDVKGNVLVPMSGVNVKSGSTIENISNWGMAGTDPANPKIPPSIRPAASFFFMYSFVVPLLPNNSIFPFLTSGRTSFLADFFI